MHANQSCLLVTLSGAKGLILLSGERRFAPASHDKTVEWGCVTCHQFS